ncbi:hypothetical protein O1611_g5395 [Lasiodiplodia mahajangana]|uniref:Uncharacterized protein n=1 Tax=Lasiodiplodia mahajangana TaxID=1108764 RepID=A0ACC2JL66_9PEZI|nr:hypothetical protein O1611_g5395 [Lasiodiplodia mahajangana]
MSTVLMQPHHHRVPYQGPHYIDPNLAPTTRAQDGRTLPSIRQAFPDFDKTLEQNRVGQRPSPDTSPTAFSFTGAVPSPTYTVSPDQHKRRRLSYFGGNESEKTSPVPRAYAVPPQVRSQPQSPGSEPRLIHKPWTDPDNTRPHANNDTPWPPNSIRMHERVEKPPVVPNLPPLKLERGINEDVRIENIPTYSHTGSDYTPAPSRRPSLAPSNGQWAEVRGHGYQQAAYDSYNYYHPNRVQSLSVGSAHLDRTPFSSGAYGARLQQPYMRMGELIGASGDGKQRKRRGNLPKETTDKLRAWFVAHLHHPYPTEDEKQELMRETGLQMNQISNWFINARRRQLPAMINNARAESDAMNSRAGENKGLSSNKRIKHDHDSKHHSDSEGSNYEDPDIKSAEQQQPTVMKRGSI